MNPIGASSVAFVALSALFWSGWVIGSQTDEGQEALAKAYMNFQETQKDETASLLLNDNAMRAVVCGINAGAAQDDAQKPCLAIAVGGKVFLVDAGSGAAEALVAKGVPLSRLQAVLLTGADNVRSADLDEIWSASTTDRLGARLPVFGPSDTLRVVQGLNASLGLTPANGLEPWGPAPEPGREGARIVYQGDGLVVSAFTTPNDAFADRVGYRFDYRGRSLVVAPDGRAEWAEAQLGADVLLHSAKSEKLAHLHAIDDDSPNAGNGDLFAGLRALAARAAEANTGTLVLTEASDSPLISAMQVREAKAQGLKEVVTARFGMMLELPLSSSDVNVRAL
jgi:ribonuclease Z